MAAAKVPWVMAVAAVGSAVAVAELEYRQAVREETRAAAAPGWAAGLAKRRAGKPAATSTPAGC